MVKREVLALIASAILGFGTMASASVNKSIYFDAGQYSATFAQSAHRWHLQPLMADDVDVIDRATTCAGHTHIPRGVWIVTRDAVGESQLVAPSTTALPAGFPQQLHLRTCGDDTDNAAALYVPAVVMSWIDANVGSVMIDD